MVAKADHSFLGRVAARRRGGLRVAGVHVHGSITLRLHRGQLTHLERKRIHQTVVPRYRRTLGKPISFRKWRYHRVGCDFASSAQIRNYCLYACKFMWRLMDNARRALSPMRFFQPLPAEAAAGGEGRTAKGSRALAGVARSPSTCSRGAAHRKT
jgi:hypothetical protein